MKCKIAIQKGLDDVKELLISEGYEVTNYGHNDSDANVTIITGVDEAYEEIQPAQYHGKMLVIDATNTTTEDIMKRIHQHVK